MTSQVRHLPLSLLLLRLGVALVMAVWAIDKIVNPGHAAAVFSSFYGLDALGPEALLAIGVIQIGIILFFLAGAVKTVSYGAVLAMHAVSTLSSWRQYLDAFDNLLFVAAWPMLAACVVLFLLRSHDTLLSLNGLFDRRAGSGA